MRRRERKGRFRPASLFLALLLAMGAAAAGEEPLLLRCSWANPEDLSRLDLSFAGNPMLIMLPGETLEMRAEGPEGSRRVTLMKDGRPYLEDEVLRFVAPEKPGSYYMSVALSSPTRRRAAEICVQVPLRATARRVQNGLDLSADGREIGLYRHPDRSGNAKVRDNPDSYRSPVWWMLLTGQNQEFEVAPGLKAVELVAPSEDTGVRHTDLVPVKYSMWLAVGTLRKALVARGLPGENMRLISVFRTPAHNRAIGSNAFGRHIFGDAFDFYLDSGNGKAADLNRDGKLDRRDAYPVVAVIEDLMADGAIPMGGVGIYNYKGGDHEVTMHVDQRGHRATWCYIYSPEGKRSEAAWQSRRFADLDRREETEAAARAAKEGRKYSPPRREPLQ